MIKTRDIALWFNNQIWIPRLIYAIGFQSLVTFFLTLCSIILLQLNLFHPINSVGASISVPFSWKCLLISFVTALIIIPSSIAAAQLLTAKNQSFSAQFDQNKWRFLGFVFLWATSQIIVDLLIAFCCMTVTNMDRKTTGVVYYGILVASSYSIFDYFLHKRYGLEFPSDLDYTKYKNRLIYFYERSFNRRTREMAIFVGYVLAISLVTFILFGWRMNRFFFKYPATFIDALWRVIICQPSVIWSITILSLATICRQNATKILFDLFICQARLVKLLLDSGIDVNAVDRFGKTALMHAATLGARAAVRTILDSDDVDTKKADHFGNTALILACSAGHDTVTILLLEHLKKKITNLDDIRSYLDIENNSGDTALTLALKNGHVDCANLLSEYFKPLQFILPSSDPIPIGQENDLFFTLGEALSIDHPTLLKYLAFLDLRQLTSQRQPRMQQIYTVSRPGGHPRTWLSIAQPMINTLQHQIKMFREINDRLAAAWEFKIEQATSGRGMTIGDGRLQSMNQPKHWQRDWKLQNNAPPNNDIINRQLATSVMANKGITNGYLPAFVKGLWVINNPLLGHERLWADLKLQLWNIEAFGHIISRSYKEDTFGVVQRDLATIIGHLLDLYSVSDRYARLVTSQRVDRYRKLEMDSHLTALRNNLIVTLEEICGVFGNLNDIRLTDQQQQSLRRLLDSGCLRK